MLALSASAGFVLRIPTVAPARASIAASRLVEARAGAHPLASSMARAQWDTSAADEAARINAELLELAEAVTSATVEASAFAQIVTASAPKREQAAEEPAAEESSAMTVAQAAAFMQDASLTGTSAEAKAAFLESKGVDSFVITQAACTSLGAYDAFGPIQG